MTTCWQCQRKFRFTSMLVDHLQTHTQNVDSIVEMRLKIWVNGRKLKCAEPGCKKKFAYTLEYTRHRDTHQYAGLNCSLCQAEQTGPTEYAAHIRAEHRDHLFSSQTHQDDIAPPPRKAKDKEPAPPKARPPPPPPVPEPPVVAPPASPALSALLPGATDPRTPQSAPPVMTDSPLPLSRPLSPQEPKSAPPTTHFSEDMDMMINMPIIDEESLNPPVPDIINKENEELMNILADLKTCTQDCTPEYNPPEPSPGPAQPAAVLFPELEPQPQPVILDQRAGQSSPGVIRRVPGSPYSGASLPYSSPQPGPQYSQQLGGYSSGGPGEQFGAGDTVQFSPTQQFSPAAAVNNVQYSPANTLSSVQYSPVSQANGAISVQYSSPANSVQYNSPATQPSPLATHSFPAAQENRQRHHSLSELAGLEPSQAVRAHLANKILGRHRSRSSSFESGRSDRLSVESLTNSLPACQSVIISRREESGLLPTTIQDVADPDPRLQELQAQAYTSAPAPTGQEIAGWESSVPGGRQLQPGITGSLPPSPGRQAAQQSAPTPQPAQPDQDDKIIAELADWEEEERGLTCARCGSKFVTEQSLRIHDFQCGKSQLPVQPQLSGLHEKRYTAPTTTTTPRHRAAYISLTF